MDGEMMGGLSNLGKKLNPCWGFPAEFKCSFLKGILLQPLVTLKPSFLLVVS